MIAVRRLSGAVEKLSSTDYREKAIKVGIHPLAPGAACGIDEPMIRTLVHAF